MKVVNLVKTTAGGNWALRQMKELVKLGVEVHVALPDQGGLWPEYVKAGIMPHLLQTDFPLGRPWLLSGRTAGLRRLVDAVRPDMIHSHFVGTTLTMRLALRKHREIPRIFQVPGPLHLEQAFFRKAEIATAQANDFWIATCGATRDRYLASGVSADRVHLTYYGIYPDELLSRRTAGKLRGELGLGAGTPIVGMVAYIYKPKAIMGKRRGIKGHEDLIDAVEIASKRIPGLKAVFIGGAWAGAEVYAESVKQYAEARIPGRAFFLGTRQDVPELYADFDVAVHPSHSENLGGAGESLLMGVPTIATNVGGFPDIVIPGVTGWLVPPARPEELASAIVHALENRAEAEKLAAAGQAKVVAELDIRRTSAKVFEIYQSILSSESQAIGETQHGDV